MQLPFGDDVSALQPLRSQRASFSDSDRSEPFIQNVELMRWCSLCMGAVIRIVHSPTRRSSGSLKNLFALHVEDCSSLTPSPC